MATSAIERNRQVLAQEPQNAGAFHALGVAMLGEGDFSPAVEMLARAIELNPTSPRFYLSMSAALKGMGDGAAAVGCLREAAKLFPADVMIGQALDDALKAWAGVAVESGDRKTAERIYRELAARRPHDAGALRTLAALLAANGATDEAVSQYLAATAVTPDDPVLLNDLATTLAQIGRFDAARTSYEAVLALVPKAPGVLLNLTNLLQVTCDWHGIEQKWEQVREAITDGPDGSMSPFYYLCAPTSAAEQRRCASAWVAVRAGKERHAPPPSPSMARHDRLRLGYMSADYRQHATSYLLGDVLTMHDRAAVSVSAYSIGPNDGSACRARIEEAADRFVDFSALSSHEAAERIRADNIDILMDLNSHTRLSRPEIMAARPAPIQVSYLGYPGTTGAPYIDYLIVDPFVVPPDQAEHFSERLAYMPDCYQPNDRQKQISENTPSRRECGLPEHGFVFADFNQSYKITPEVFSLWMRLLASIPGSVLWLIEGNAVAPANLRQEALAAGIEPARIVFARYLPMAEHLARHRLADLFLDTLPVNGHTTASDALWAGLPVLTCAGQTFVSRVAGSLLQAVGLSELVTHSLVEYEALALALARDPERLQSLRDRLAANRLTAPLFDSERYARNLELLFQRMWDEYCRSGEPSGAGRSPLYLPSSGVPLVTGRPGRSLARHE